MTDAPPPPRRPVQRTAAPRAGGCFIALGPVLGAILGGMLYGQPSIGLLAGFGIGVAILIVLLDRRQGRG